MANKITIEKMIGGVINITSYGYPSKETTSWLDGEGLPEIPVYDGFDDYLWVVDESRSTSMYLDEFKRLLQEQNPQPKYNVKSLQNDKVTWGYVSLWNHFSTNPSYKDGFENIVQELPQNMTTIRFPFQVYKNNNLIRGAVMYAEVKRVTGEATLTWINGSNHLTTTVKLIGETGALVGELPDSSIITGYDFNGWFTQQNGQGLQVTPETKVYGDSTFYANYTPIEYTITYNTNGHGELPSNLPTKYTIESETITPSQLLSNDDNWIFKGWQPQSIPHGSTGNKTFNAQWEEVQQEEEPKDTYTYFTTQGANHVHKARLIEFDENAHECEECHQMISNSDIITLYGGEDCSLKVIDLHAFCALDFITYTEKPMKLKSVYFPKGVTDIMPCAFYKCTHLESVVLPNEPLSDDPNMIFGVSAFEGCTKLTELSISANVYNDLGTDLVLNSGIKTLYLPGYTISKVINDMDRLGIPNGCKVICSNGNEQYIVDRHTSTSQCYISCKSNNLPITLRHTITKEVVSFTEKTRTQNIPIGEYVILECYNNGITVSNLPTVFKQGNTITFEHKLYTIRDK